MTKCYTNPLPFSSIKGRKIEADFSGGDITSDAGALLLRESNRQLKLSQAIAQGIQDPRDSRYIEHELETMVKQRLFGLALGYEDLNDHTELRKDVGLQISADQESVLASASTLNRLEQWADRQTSVSLHQILFNQFVSQCAVAPTQLILDFDATDDPVHGDQIGKFYHGYYRHECFLPLHVYCGRFPLVSYLRPSWMDPAKHAWAILKLLVKALRNEWPDVEIIFRGDSAFSKPKMMSWCERNNVGYVLGIGKNQVLTRLSQAEIEQAERLYEQNGIKQRIFTSVMYQASSWVSQRRVIVKAEHTLYGANPRYVVSNLEGSDTDIYDTVYCARGEMENRIKEIQADLFSDRTSCHQWWPNQLRLLFSTFAQVLVNNIRAKYLSGTRWACATVNTIRLTFLKIAAVIVSNTRRIRFLMPSHYPHQRAFSKLVEQLNSS